MPADRRHLAVEILIENVDNDFRREPVGQRGKAAQVRQPDRSLHGFGVAAANLARKDALAGAIAHIGIKQRGRVAAKLEDFAQAREGRATLRSASSCSSLNPLAAFVVRLEEWIEPSVKCSGNAI